MARRSAFFLLGALLGCAEPPAVPLPGMGEGDAGARLFADTVIAYTSGGIPTACTMGLPVCGEATPPCAANAVLGANDGNVYTLDVGGRLEVGFRCNIVTERGGMDTPEIKIWSTVQAGSEAVVEVSYDGSNFADIGILDVTTNSFDLERIPVQSIRFVRIAMRQGTGISIDAVEALR